MNTGFYKDQRALLGAFTRFNEDPENNGKFFIGSGVIPEGDKRSTSFSRFDVAKHYRVRSRHMEFLFEYFILWICGYFSDKVSAFNKKDTPSTPIFHIMQTSSLTQEIKNRLSYLIHINFILFYVN